MLTWTYHPRPLNTAVANSALMIATRYGMDVTLLCPTPEYVLDPRYMDFARSNVAENGGSLKISHDVDDAYRAPKSSTRRAGARSRTSAAGTRRNRFAIATALHRRHAQDGADERRLFSHCLPLRRNVKATDAVMDSPACIAIDEAENRLHVQKAIMAALVKQDAPVNEHRGGAK